MRAADPAGGAAGPAGGDIQRFRTQRSRRSLDLLHTARSSCSLMKRTFVVPFLSALLGGAVVVAVVAASGGLGESTRRWSRPSKPAAPGRRRTPRQMTDGLTPHEAYVRDAPGCRVRDLDGRAEDRILPFNLFGEQNAASGHGHRLGHRDRREWHDPDQLSRDRERRQGHRQLRKRQDRRSARWSARTPPTISRSCASRPMA